MAANQDPVDLLQLLVGGLVLVERGHPSRNRADGGLDENRVDEVADRAEQITERVDVVEKVGDLAEPRNGPDQEAEHPADALGDEIGHLQRRKYFLHELGELLAEVLAEL